MLKRIALFFLFASYSWGAPSFTANLAHTYVNAGATTLTLQTAQATLLPTPYPTQYVILSKTASGTTAPQTFVYVSKDNDTNSVVVSPSTLKPITSGGNYLLTFAGTPTNTATPVDTPTPVPTATPTHTSTSTPIAVGTVILDITAGTPVPNVISNPGALVTGNWNFTQIGGDPFAPTGITASRVANGITVIGSKAATLQWGYR